MTLAFSRTSLLVLALGVASAATVRAQGSSTLRGTVRDSSTGVTLSGAVVELRSNAAQKSVRTDEEGRFVFSAVASGSYRVSALRVGYTVRTVDVVLNGRDSTLSISLGRTPQMLERFDVMARNEGLYGIIAGAPSLRLLAGAAVRVIGANRAATTDSLGGYSIPKLKPGNYMVRASAAGFDDQLFSVEIPRGRALEASRLLDTTLRAPVIGDQSRLDDFDRRATFRGPNSAIIPGSDLRKVGGSLREAMQGTKAMAIKGLHFGATTCVYVDGRPRPNFPLDAINIEEVEAVEVYADRNSETTGQLAKDWPRAIPCSNSTRLVMSGQQNNTSNSNSYVQWVVVWTKR